jgi:hypothetical protein
VHDVIRPSVCRGRSVRVVLATCVPRLTAARAVAADLAAPMRAAGALDVPPAELYEGRLRHSHRYGDGLQHDELLWSRLFDAVHEPSSGARAESAACEGGAWLRSRGASAW